MTITDILGLSGGGIIVILTLLQIAPIKINPWGAIARGIGRAIRGIGRAINSDILRNIDDLRKDVIEVRTDISELEVIADKREAARCRAEILSFNSELLHDIQHTEEHFNHILRAITIYSSLCDRYPDFENGIIAAAIDNIKRVHSMCMQQHKFL